MFNSRGRENNSLYIYKNIHLVAFVLWECSTLPIQVGNQNNNADNKAEHKGYSYSGYKKGKVCRTEDTCNQSDVICSADLDWLP